MTHISIKYYLNKCHVTYYMQTSPCKIFPKTYFAKISEKRVSNNVITDNYTYATRKSTIKTRE